jgi:hypothetical protein
MIAVYDAVFGLVSLTIVFVLVEGSRTRVAKAALSKGRVIPCVGLWRMCQNGSGDG